MKCLGRPTAALLCAALGFFFPVTAAAQNTPSTISGRFVDARSEAPLSNAKIPISQGGTVVETVTTDVAGKFSVSGLGPGIDALTLTVAARFHRRS
jgi:uncharacterized surface anchored protein